jgi:Tol biopolymer transport system component
MEWLRDDYTVAQARFSPDAHFIAYLSDEIEADVFEVYIAPFDPGQPDGGRANAKPVKVSGKGALGMISWRRDGQELYYMTPDWEVMVMQLITTPTVQVGEPRLLFKLPGPLPGNDGNSPARWKSVSPDGERFVVLLDVPVTDITK